MRASQFPPVPLRSAAALLVSCFVSAGCTPSRGGPEDVPATAEEFVANYDETLVPDYTLPDPLVTLAGEPVSDAETWRDVRRPEILALFEEHVF
jgi:predicted small secreted protein